jgi:RES domain-containing protein
MKITAYWTAKKKFADSIWSGHGAREYGGRWNSPGITVVYTAENRSLAAMEQLVHLIRPRILRGYVISSISFDDAQVQRINPEELPPDWKNPVPPSSLKEIGDLWAAAGQFPVLAVPSIITPKEWNYLINPGHPEFAEMHKSPVEPFAYDERLG